MSYDFDFSTKSVDPRIEEYNRIKKERFIAAKKAYSEMTKEQNQIYKKQKQAHEETYKAPETREQLRARAAEIARLESQLNCHKRNYGSAQMSANVYKQQMLEKEAQDQIKEAERQIIEQKRYLQAIKTERASNPIHKKKTIIERINSSRQAANCLQNENVANYQKQIKKSQIQQARQKQKDEEASIIHRPPIDPEMLYTIPGVGTIPMNQAALQFQEKLNQQTKLEKEESKVAQRSFKDRAKLAAERAKTEKARHALSRDIQNIYNYEIQEQLEHCKHPEIELPMSAAYCVEEKYRQKHDKIKAYFTAPDSPIPRSSAPSPQPYRLVSSPTQSGDNSLE